MDVFAYGTLMFASVWERVAGPAPASVPATLWGYERRGVHGADYPVVVRGAPSATVSGRVFRDVDDGLLARLDAYEGPCYRRVREPLRFENETAAAWVYVLRERFRSMATTTDWDPETFKANRLAAYLATINAGG